MNLGVDLVDEILLRLPVKSLLRFKVVCKDWYHRHNKRYTVSIHSEAEKEEDCDDEDSTTLFLQSDPQEYLVPKKYRIIIGTCNGLICLANPRDWWIRNQIVDESNIALWNPSTRDFKTTPYYELHFSTQGVVQIGHHIGFGFDCTTNDYKVIRILYFYNPKKYNDYFAQMIIYSLSTNNWRELDCSGLSARPFARSNNYGIFWKEKLCWCTKDTNGEAMILSFDMGKEVFQKTPLPSECEQKGFRKLFPIGNSVALVSYGIQKIYKLWTTKDLEQGRSSWIKLSNIVTISAVDRPLGCRKCKRCDDFLFMFYDYTNDTPSTKDRIRNKIAMKGIHMNNRCQIKNDRRMRIKVKNGIGIIGQVLNYEETLVSVNNR